MDSRLELKRVLAGPGFTAPGQDKVCQVTLKHLPDNILNVILDLFNKICNERKKKIVECKKLHNTKIISACVFFRISYLIRFPPNTPCTVICVVTLLCC